MKQITLRVQATTKDSLEDEASEADLSLSEYMRELISRRNDAVVDADEHARLREEHESLQDDLERVRDDLERQREENDRLKREKRQILDQRQEVTELRTYVEDEQEKRRRIEEANIVERARWFLFGYNAGR